MARDHVLSLRLDDDEHQQLTARAGSTPISDVARRILFDHLAEPPTCASLKPGNWSSGYLPVCALPTPHPSLNHWWHDAPSGDVHIWSDDGTYAYYVAGALERLTRG